MTKVVLTFPALSLSPIIFGCFDSSMILSTGKSTPVFGGTLYRMMGIGDTSAI